MYYNTYPISNNISFIIGGIVLLGLIIGITIYSLVSSCNDGGEECIITSDCCDGLECINSLCSSSFRTPSTPTPTPTPRPTVILDTYESTSNCINWNCPEGKSLIDNPSETNYQNGDQDCCIDITCEIWDVSNNCETGTTITPGEVIGNSSEECCRPLKCQEWFRSHTCNNRISLSDNTLGYSEDECCEEGTWHFSEPDDTNWGESCDTLCSELPEGPKYCHPVNNNIDSEERLLKVMEAASFDSSQCSEGIVSDRSDDFCWGGICEEEIDNTNMIGVYPTDGVNYNKCSYTDPTKNDKVFDCSLERGFFKFFCNCRDEEYSD